ncbi:MAG: putative glycosyl transferase [Mucilaginibacter sp.]|nr:putative glycosyl transferase [Mucilaginibacter sp.]
MFLYFLSLNYVKKAFIILAHKNEDQLVRLIDRLNDVYSYFFIHIDRNSTLQQSKELFKNKENIQLLSGINTQWGCFGLVEATLTAMAAIKETENYYDRIILLSGQDYPIKNNEYLNNFLQSSQHSIFMEYFLLPNYKRWSSDGGMYRTNKYFFGFGIFNRYAAKAINFLASYITFFQRSFKNTMKHFHGSQWWIIDMHSLYYILDYVKNNPQYSSFHKYTFAPDELFFQTILLNSGNDNLIRGIFNDHKRFMRWIDESSAHPEIIKTEDFDAICNSSALFARKFDTQIDSKILDMIDEKCLNINYKK